MYENYLEFDLARSACSSDNACLGVYDENCNGVDTFRLCKKTEKLEYSQNSCVYKKPTNSLVAKLLEYLKYLI